MIATSVFGLEALVSRELADLGYKENIVENGRVIFKGDEAAICRTNLWLRKAERVLIMVGQFPAQSFEELFQGAKALPWGDWLPKDANFPVEGKSVKSKLFSVSDCQAIVKKAVVEKLKEKYNTPWFEETGPRYTIEVGLLKDIATITIDTSGPGLHKRGYRKIPGRAPLKETLASALITLSKWGPDRPLIDPFCGTGTIPIEAALMGLNIAPGLRRSFISESWGMIHKNLWEDARSEARDLAKADADLDIAGFDIDHSAISLARLNEKEAGLSGKIHFQERPLSELQTKKKYGSIICNPPYGERLDDKPVVERLYKEMGRILPKLDTWSYYILTNNPRFETLFGRTADKNRKLYNGRIECHYYQFFGVRPPKN